MPSTDHIKTVAAQLQIDLTNECVELLTAEPPPVIVAGSSGGKDSSVQAILLDKFFNAIHYQGQRLIIHADLGRIEHAESIEHVRRLSEFLDWPLLVTKREKGDLLDRYEQRWRDNCRRYALLECVTLISPWPSPQMPFCRSEVKVAPIIQALTKRFPGQTILSCVGLRAEESATRAKKPVFQRNSKFDRRDGTTGYDWHPIHNTPIERVFLVHKQSGFPLHPQYLRGNSRVSCSFCFISSKNDLIHGAEVPTNHFSYRTIVALETRSAFSYQVDGWLGDIKPELLTTEQRLKLSEAKLKGNLRRLAEALIPPGLRFRNHGGRRGWPASQPSLAQCEELAKARNEVAHLFGNEIAQASGTAIQYLSASTIYDRYAELLQQRPQHLASVASHHPLFQIAAAQPQLSPAA